eukprot:TRINITY_DN88280_c0_g1_i1.p1 TRINITY_DN88280_c0_g1~~TRINITY_DN88280_c0_g1_i1.p1  ORF type:complete len:207 (-),score=15.60 TRINITY_DN88280_c0_g1_i1:47-667(-)
MLYERQQDDYYIRVPSTSRLGERRHSHFSTVRERDSLGATETTRRQTSSSALYNSSHTVTPNIYAFRPYPDINTTNPSFQKYHQIDFTTGRDLTFFNLLADAKSHFLFADPPPPPPGYSEPPYLYEDTPDVGIHSLRSSRSGSPFRGAYEYNLGGSGWAAPRDSFEEAVGFYQPPPLATQPQHDFTASVQSALALLPTFSTRSYSV